MKTKKRDLIETWRKLQTSDHFYYMCTKWSNDGDVHAYFSPYQSPYDAYIAFMNALSDLKLRVQHVVEEKEKKLADVDAQPDRNSPDSISPSPPQPNPPGDSRDDARTVPDQPSDGSDPGFFGKMWNRLKNIFPLVSPKQNPS